MERNGICRTLVRKTHCSDIARKSDRIEKGEEVESEKHVTPQIPPNLKP
jgi:hypothetical protein